MFLLLGLSLAPLALGCAATDDEAEGGDQAIRKGVADLTHASSVVQVYTRQKLAGGSWGDERYCSGVVLSPTRVLTAASCFVFQQWAWEPSASFETQVAVALGPHGNLAELRDALQPAPIGWLFPDEVAKNDPLLPQKSVVVIHLTAPIAGAEPIAIGPAPESRAPVTVHGYGCARSGTDGATLRSRELAWGSWDGLASVFLGPSFSCAPGDAGAVVLDISGRLVGLSVRPDKVLAITGTLAAKVAAEVDALR